MKAGSADIQKHIQDWSAKLGNLSWWPRYVYHFTDVQNAAQIIQNGFLYCRTEVERQSLMQVDNASPEVIQQTNPEYFDYVRLYFRPRTPTQFRNEGIRPLNQRELGRAHCPVPVFFCFDALTVLSLDETKFSNGNMGSPRVAYGDDQIFFFSIPFDLVFHNRWFSTHERDEIIFRRNAEVLVPEKLALEPVLKFIACRSVAERQTLLSLLPLGVANRWLSRIRIGTSDLFERHWTYVEEVTVVDDRVIFRFNPNTRTPGPFEVRFSYQEDGTDHERFWQGRKNRLNTILSFKLAGARWGTVSLHLDNALAFTGLILLEEIPF